MSDQNIELKKIQSENQRLKVAVEELSVLNEIATAISSTMDLQKVVDLIVQKCVKHLKVDQGAVMLLDESDKKSSLQTMVRKVDTVSSGLPFRLDDQLTGWMLKNQQPLLINDLQSDNRFQVNPGDNLSIKSLIAVPLQSKGRMIGVLTVFNRRSEEGFSEDDKRLLTIIAAQSAQVIETARLYLEEQQYQIMQQDMNIARQIQQNLLPKKAPLIDGYALAGVSYPATQVGGDYYDFVTLPDGKIAFCLGDVSGKGMPAAMLMSNLQATLRGQTINCSCARECLEKSNFLLYQSTDSEKYATLFYGILDPANNRLAYANAGHNHPIMIAGDGSHQRLKTIGIPLGFLERFEFSEHTIPFATGSILVLFSDGISEAMNVFEEEFEEERILDIVLAHMDAGPSEIIGHIIDAVKKHAGEAAQSDDMTLVVIKRF
jgi:sigma-B regulation protein RsbU (phosphoserine phosphatase)